MGSFSEFLEQMQQSYQELTGVRVDDASDIGIRFKILAEQLEVLNKALEEAKQQTFPQTATGETLDMHALQRGIRRKQATASKGAVIFSRESAAQEDILIPEGVFLTGTKQEGENDTDIRFVTTQTVILQSGKTQVSAPVQCQTAGSVGNIASGVLTVMITPVQGITAVSNPEPIVSGEDEESDENLRQRLLDSYHQVTNGTNAAFYYNKAMSYEGVSTAKVLPRVNGIGTVGIVLYGPSVDEELIKKVKEEIGQIKEINVDLTVEKASEKQVTVSMEIAVENGYSYEDVSAACKNTVERYMKRQKIAQPLYSALLIRELLNCEGVANCRIIEPEEDIYPLEKEVLRLSDCTISQMQHQQRRERSGC